MSEKPPQAKRPYRRSGLAAATRALGRLTADELVDEIIYSPRQKGGRR